MKNNIGKVCLWKISAIFTVFGLVLALAGCDNGSSETSSFADTLHLSGQVYTADWNEAEFRIVYNAFFGNLAVSASMWVEGTGDVSLGGAGAITGGRLNFSIGRPAPVTLQTIQRAGVTVSPAAVRSAELLIFETHNGFLSRRSEDVSGDEFEGSITVIEVIYIFVDRETVISAYRSVVSNDECKHGECWDDCLDNNRLCWCECFCTDCHDYGFIWTETFNAFNIPLSEGWNVISIKDEFRWTENSGASTITILPGEPNGTRWVLHVWGDLPPDIMPISSPLPQNLRRSFMRNRQHLVNIR